MDNLIRPALGLLQGIVIYLLINYTHLSNAALVCSVILLTFPLFALQIKLPTVDTLPMGLGIVVVMALVYSYVAYYLVNALEVNGNLIAPILGIQCIASAFIFYVFYCVVIEEKRFSFPYISLFNEAWRVVLKLLLGQLLVTLIWGLFLLAGQLFALLNLSFVQDIVLSPSFFYIMPPLFFGIAMAILHQYEDLLTRLRNILLVFCKILYPLFVVINICFLIAVPFAHIAFNTFWQTIILLSGINIVLFNGIYQAGFDKPPYSKWFCALIYLSLILTMVYSLYILKFPWGNSTHQPDQLLFIISLALLALYSVFYVVAIFLSRKPWLSLIKVTNTSLALVTAIVYLVLALPTISDKLAHMLAL